MKWLSYLIEYIFVCETLLNFAFIKDVEFCNLGSFFKFTVNKGERYELELPLLLNEKVVLFNYY
jgi:hypothetical protein